MKRQMSRLNYLGSDPPHPHTATPQRVLSRSRNPLVACWVEELGLFPGALVQIPTVSVAAGDSTTPSTWSWLQFEQDFDGLGRCSHAAGCVRVDHGDKHTVAQVYEMHRKKGSNGVFGDCVWILCVSEDAAPYRGPSLVLDPDWHDYCWCCCCWCCCDRHRNILTHFVFACG
mmetsp:Transcript_26947/g.42696  ORF Transcript_26947/g.42696 Transcript_26947/m.42696 type:complete len:172 (+) Transcript_26947:619-1134(+)